MSTPCIVPVVTLSNVREHPNASLLGLADVLGYQMAIPLVEDANGNLVRKFVRGKLDEKGRRVPADAATPADDTVEIRYSFRYKDGDVCVYFPADTLIPAEWADKFGVRQLLKGKEQNRVGKIKLRGEPSFGLVVDIPPERADWKVGDNVADYYGCRKYEPPIRVGCGDAAPYDTEIDPFFDKFTDVQNGRIETGVFQDGEEVIYTEKLHGSNCRLAMIRGVAVAGSMEIRRKRPVRKASDGQETTSSFEDEEMKRSTYWFPWTLLGVRRLLESSHPAEYSADPQNMNTILYGEVYGGSIQSLDYGIPKGKGLGFRAFGLRVNGKFLDWDDFVRICGRHGVETVPVLWRGPFSMAKAKELADGKAAMAGHLREGTVVYPVKERDNPKVGRAILKFVGTEYDLMTGKTDFKDV